MARRRASDGRSRAGTTRNRRIPTSQSEQVPRVYQQMLSEASQPATDSQTPEGRPHKRLRIGERGGTHSGSGGVLAQERPAVAQQEPKPLQTAYDVDASEDSEADWEDVDLEPAVGTPTSLAQPQTTNSREIGDETLQITLGQQAEDKRRKTPARRKPITALEKKWRLDIHKVHILCLLGHARLRNAWCNDAEVQVHKLLQIAIRTIYISNIALLCRRT